jgi:hypothetical protein
MDTHSRFFRVPREEIAYLKCIIESYEGMAVLRTRDPQEAIVELMIAPGWERDFEELIEGLREEILIEPVVGDGEA